MLVTLRLVAPDAEPPGPATQPVVAHAVYADVWAQVLASLDHHLQEVQQAWADTVAVET
jgi:glutamate-ammonia-ligase adenylyltransferase